MRFSTAFRAFHLPFSAGARTCCGGIAELTGDRDLPAPAHTRRIEDALDDLDAGMATLIALEEMARQMQQTVARSAV